jgi:hypothetical protein
VLLCDGVEPFEEVEGFEALLQCFRQLEVVKQLAHSSHLGVELPGFGRRELDDVGEVAQHVGEQEEACRHGDHAEETVGDCGGELGLT